jgi:hypothetical protein
MIPSWRERKKRERAQRVVARVRKGCDTYARGEPCYYCEAMERRFGTADADEIMAIAHARW